VDPGGDAEYGGGGCCAVGAGGKRGDPHALVRKIQFRSHRLAEGKANRFWFGQAGSSPAINHRAGRDAP
jgi:hypothetical protein